MSFNAFSSPTWFTPARKNLTLACVALIGAVGCGAIVADTFNSLDLHSPEFFKWFFGLAVISFAIATWVRWKLRQPSDAPPEDFSNMDPYSAAFLNKGKPGSEQRHCQSHSTKIIKADAEQKRLNVKGELPPDAHPLERAVHSASNGQRIADVRIAAIPVVMAMMEQLQTRGLLVSPSQIGKGPLHAIADCADPHCNRPLPNLFGA